MPPLPHLELMMDLVKFNKDVADIANSTTRLVEYTKKIQDIGPGFNPMSAPLYLRDFIMAYDLAGAALAKAMRCDLEADHALEVAEAIAYLERAPEYLKEKGLRDTVESKKYVVDLDPDVRVAKEMKAKTMALVAFYKTKAQGFRMALETLKKIAYGGDAFRSPEEGM